MSVETPRPSFTCHLRRKVMTFKISQLQEYQLSCSGNALYCTNKYSFFRLSYFQLFDKQIKDSLKVGNTAQLAPSLENYVLASNVRRPSSSVRHLQYVVLPSTNNFGNVDWKQNLWWPLRILNWPRKIRVCVFSFWNAHKSHHLHSNFQISVSNFGYGYLVVKRFNTE